MKLALIGDSHFCEAIRWDEGLRIHHWIGADIEARGGVDVVLHSGDIFHRKSTPTERSAVASWVQSIARRWPMIIVRGNHDADVDLEIFGRLETRFPVSVVEDAGVVVVRDIHGARLGDVACLAWPRKAHLLAHLLANGGADAATPEASSAAAQEAIRCVLRGFAAYSSKTDTELQTPLVLLAHALVTGSISSSGQPLVGHDMELALEDLTLARADMIALGHIHKAQEWAVGETPIIYPGSPRRTDFGELEPKGYVIAEVETAPTRVRWERIDTPATPMIHVEATWKDGPAWMEIDGIGNWSDAKGAEVRFRYTVDADQRDAARAAAALAREDLTDAGAVFVKVEEVIRPKTRARAPEICQALTLEAKVAALWKARGEDLGDRATRLLDKVRALRAEAGS